VLRNRGFRTMIDHDSKIGIAIEHRQQGR